jgi:hypothetical protein
MRFDKTNINTNYNIIAKWTILDYIFLRHISHQAFKIDHFIAKLSLPRVNFHIDKTNNFFFSKNEILLKILKIIYFSIIYYNICDMSSEIVQSVAYAFIRE